MRYPSNHLALDDLAGMAIGDIAALPSEELLHLQDEAEANFDAARRIRERLQAGLATKFSEEADRLRAAAGKTAGTVRIQDGDVMIVAELPKRIAWDQAMLADLAARIREAGDDPSEYLDISFKVPERKFNAWPAALREGFAAARSEGTGKPGFRLERQSPA